MGAGGEHTSAGVVIWDKKSVFQGPAGERLDGVGGTGTRAGTRSVSRWRRDVGGRLNDAERAMEVRVVVGRMVRLMLGERGRVEVVISGGGGGDAGGLELLAAQLGGAEFVGVECERTGGGGGGSGGGGGGGRGAGVSGRGAGVCGKKLVAVEVEVEGVQIVQVELG